MRLLPNQPIVFDFPNNGQFPPNYRQIVNVGDITMFQFRIDPCAGVPNSLKNPVFFSSDFWTIGGTGWTIGVGSAIKTGATPSSLNQSGLTVNSFYCAEILINELVGPEGFTVSFGTGSNTISTTAKPTGTGVYKAYGFATETEITITCAGTTTAKIIYVNVFEVDKNISFAVQRLDNTFETIVNLSDDLPYNTRSFIIEDNFVTFNFDWVKINNLVLNGDFRFSQDKWVIDTALGQQNISFDKELRYTNFGVIGLNESIVKQTDVIYLDTVSYRVRFTVKEFTVPVGEDWRVGIGVDSPAAAPGVRTTSITGVGDVEVTLTNNTGATEQLGITQFNVLAGSLGSVVLDDFCITEIGENCEDLIDNGCYNLCIIDPCINTNGQTGFFNDNFRLGFYEWDTEDTISSALIIPNENNLSITAPTAFLKEYEFTSDLKIGLQYQWNAKDNCRNPYRNDYSQQHNFKNDSRR